MYRRRRKEEICTEIKLLLIAFKPPVFKLSKYIYYHSHYFLLSLFTHILSSSFLLLFVCWAKVLSLFTLLTIHLQFIFSFLFFLTCVRRIFQMNDLPFIHPILVTGSTTHLLLLLLLSSSHGHDTTLLIHGQESVLPYYITQHRHDPKYDHGQTR